MPPPTIRPSIRRLRRRFVAASVISVLAFAADKFLPTLRTEPETARTKASQNMAAALDVVQWHRKLNGPPMDLSVDPNETGLIGVEYSGITTTLGELGAKRTTTNPAMASLMVDLLEQAGARRGDRVAVGCSGSFPGLFVAVLAAADALEIEPVIVMSLGASSYGANRLDFTLLDLSLLLNRRKVLPHTVAAASLGGSGDIGSEYESSVRDSLIAKIRSAGILLLRSGSLQEAVQERLSVYGIDSLGQTVSAFVNIGGGYADMGTDPWVLTLQPGLHRTMEVPGTVGERGVLLTMADLGIPVIHLLFVKGLVHRYGLPWDPVPLTEGGRAEHGIEFWIALILYLTGLGMAFSHSHRSGGWDQ